jgi:hypothetical protein
MDTLSSAVGNIIQETWMHLLTEISKDYNISFEELKSKYIVDGLPPTRRRGRKKKIKDEYIETEEFEHGDKTFLIDNNGIVYSNDQKHPIMLGHKQKDGTIKWL